jgi:hypothetical protein
MVFNGVVDAPKTAPARFGLLSVAEVVDHPASDEHWVSKAYWQPELCSYDVQLVDVCNPGAPTDVVFGSAAGDSEATGFGIDVTDLCTSTFGYSFEERKLRLKKAADTVTQVAAETQLWTELEAVNIMDIVGATNVTLKHALGKVEQALGCTAGAGGVIHVSREIATLLVAENLVIRSSTNPDMLETVLGTPVIAGHGYGSDRIYGSGPVVLHLGPVVIYEGPNISINDLVNKAERPAELVWDPCCLVAATPRTELTS